ncbi:MAG: hypothetical protein AAFW89_06420 [Bacteroidota bacterium]
MKKTKRIVLPILVCIALAGCATKTEYGDAQLVSEFPEPIQLEGEKILLEEHEVYKPFYIEFIDSLLVVSTQTDGKLLAIYDNEGTYQVSFGRLGQGPNELNDYPDIYNYQIQNQTIVTTFDINLLTLDKINLTKSM